MTSRGFVQCLGWFALLSVSKAQSDPNIPFAGWANVTEFPAEQKDNVTALLNEAASLSAGGNIYPFFESSCIQQQVYPNTFSIAMTVGFVEPFAAFDNLYYVGQGAVAAWAYNTSEGVVLIDALDNAAEAEGVIVPGLEAVGLSGSDIKHVIITHEHFDHYGGAKYLQDTFGARIYGSEPFWDAMEALSPNETVTPPARNETLTDGQDLVVGGVTFHTILTPGHTLGTLSLIFPVTDRDEKHVVGFMGGTGDPSDTAMREMKVASIAKYVEVASERGVDTLLSNHNIADHALYKADMLDHRDTAPNPYVIGTDAYVNYLKTNALCTQVLSAREGKDMASGVQGEAALRRRSLSLSTQQRCNH
ncbi:beta-lactamase-like protein [Diaporthe sp. PMI_573]|nr:beta-lactamase-like protein [Diaporthaceae sp. PMI_573]